MKKIYSLIVVAMGSLVLASCGDDDYTEKVNTIQVEKSETTINGAGGAVEIKLTGEGLTATSAADWLTASINGNVLTASADANPTRESRASHIDVKAANGDTYLVSIVQQGALLALETNNLEVTDMDGSYDVAVEKAGMAVSVKSLTDWVKASMDSETKSIKVAVESNDVDEARQGKILVTSGTLSDTLFVNQAAMKFVLSKTNASIMTKSAGSTSVTVTHSKPVTVESKSDWLTATLSGNTIRLTAKASTEIRRLGEVSVKSGKSEKTLYVSQFDFAEQFDGAYRFLFYDDEEKGWYYFNATVNDKGITFAPFKDNPDFNIPLTINKTAKTVKTANCGTYVGEWTASSTGTTYYIYLAWGSGTKWSTTTVTNAAMTGSVSVASTLTGKTVTIIDWAGSWVYSGTTYQADSWLMQAMSGKAFTQANNKGYLLKMGEPYLMSDTSASSSAKRSNKNGCMIETPSGEMARPAVLKYILRRN